MAKWFGKIGYAEMNYERPGISDEVIIEKEYYGNLIQTTRRLQSSDKVNDDIVLSNQIKIISDPYALENFQNIRYATFMRTRWKVTTVNVVYPSLLLTLGGVWNEASGPAQDSDDPSELS